MYYDTHTHLNDEKLYTNRRKHLQRFIDAGGIGLVNVGVDHEWNMRAIEIAQSAKNEKMSCRVKATIGYHPSEVCFGNITKENIDEKMSQLEKLYQEHKEYIVGIGECGIDTHYPDGSTQIEMQKELFRRQCVFAKQVGLPIVIHSRDDFASTLDVIKDFTDQKIYFHCYGYGSDEVQILQALFPTIWFGFCGNVTYPKAQQLRDALAACDIHNIVCETDAPYLSPQKVRGETNEPENVKYIYEFIATLLETDENEYKKAICENAEALYGIVRTS